MNLAWVRMLFAVVCLAGGWLALAKVYAGEHRFYGTVTKVVDGDTIHFRNVNSRENSPRMRIRMVGMDTPETHLQSRGRTYSQGFWGEAASEALEELIPEGTPVSIVSHEMDKYGRVLGRVYSHERDVNLKMVLMGWAIPYFICSGPLCDKEFIEREFVADYFEACDRARSEGRGIFDPENPLTEMPFEFRLRVQRRRPERYVGDYNSGLLYPPNEYKKVDVCRRIFFNEEEDAYRMGFRRRR